MYIDWKARVQIHIKLTDLIQIALTYISSSAVAFPLAQKITSVSETYLLRLILCGELEVHELSEFRKS